jgi:hypothetical protein
MSPGALKRDLGIAGCEQDIMTIEHLASVGFWIVIASAVTIGQQRDQSAGPGPKAPAEGAVIRTSPDGSALPSRSVETRRESGGRELRTETVETPDSDGRLKPSGETITEATRRTPNVMHTKRDVFTYNAPGQRTLLETIESEQEILADGNSRSVQSTWAPDSSGRLGLTSRQVQQTKSIAPDVKQTDTAVFRPGAGDGLQESERIQLTERQVRPDLLRTDSTRSVRDMNGRFQRTEERSQEVRTIEPSRHLEEETVQRLDADGKLSLSERNVTRRSVENGRDQTVKETFSRNIAGALMRSDNRMELSQRVRRTTTIAADGGGQTIEEVEARNLVSPNEPMRMVRRTVETVRKVNAERWQTERQVFILDVNGRWVLATAETGQQTER